MFGNDSPDSKKKKKEKEEGNDSPLRPSSSIQT